MVKMKGGPRHFLITSKKKNSWFWPYLALLGKWAALSGDLGAIWDTLIYASPRCIKQSLMHEAAAFPVIFPFRNIAILKMSLCMSILGPSIMSQLSFFFSKHKSFLFTHSSPCAWKHCLFLTLLLLQRSDDNWLCSFVFILGTGLLLSLNYFFTISVLMRLIWKLRCENMSNWLRYQGGNLIIQSFVESPKSGG